MYPSGLNGRSARLAATAAACGFKGAIKRGVFREEKR